VSIKIRNLAISLLVALVVGCSSNDSTMSTGETNNLPEPGTPAAAMIDEAIECTGATEDIEAAILQLINTYRAEERMCGDVLFPAAAAVTWNDDLQQAALNHSADMAMMNFFAHTGSNGLSVSERVAAEGYNWQTVGENIAGGQDNTEIVMSEWIASPSHCANIMNPENTETGAACWENPNSNLKVYWTSVLANAFP